MYAYPKHVRTDHPVLVYKTCEIEQTVPRLFSCLPPSQSPHKSLTLALCFAPLASCSITSTIKSCCCHCLLQSSESRQHAVHPLQPAHIDATSLRYQLAIFKPFPFSVDYQVRPLTDPAPTSAAVCTITCDMPYRKAVNTSTWAASPMRPATTFTDANGSTAIDWRAKSGDAFPIDSGTMPPFLRRQEDAPLPTTGSTRDATTHGGQEASCPRSPVSGAFVDPDAPAPSFSDSHAAIAFTCDHRYHPPDPLGHQDIKPPGSRTADDTVANAPMPLLPTKVKHFTASPGPRTK